MPVPLDLQYAILSLTYVALLLFSVRYMRSTTRGAVSSIAAILGACTLPLALVLVLMHWRIHDLFGAAPAMFLSFIAWVVAGARGERAALIRPSQW